ncbi:hypothetical protein [Pseudoxanthomonas sp.]|uniref:hypothetical protein n=1 Tax=Pseudoxanthomonas sp. TaxID=1871049 RepID=UPI002633A643|nr:hypothetical protein [Pseudoxanthomonas sp.]WDS37190.1 MAG: hypothetical protein O8I58_04665 [Pseudoxanthomonas sp.]
MSHIEDAYQSNNGPSDFTLLEGLYQLAVTGHTQDWEFERLNNAVYERLISSYGSEDTTIAQSTQNVSAFAG